MKFFKFFKKEKPKFNPPTYEQMQGFFALMAECVQEQIIQKKALVEHKAECRKLFETISNGNQETLAAIDLLFARVIELEQAIQNAGMEIPRANKVLN